MDNIVLIRNLEDLYVFLSQYEDIAYKDGQLAMIKDHLDAAYTGCPCKRKNFEAQAFTLVKDLNKNINYEVVAELKNHIKKDLIMFMIDGNHLFDL